MPEIRFGTSGWRAVIAQDFTFDAVRLVTKAIALHLKNHGHKGEEVVVGYDTRFLGDQFAMEAARVLKSEGLEPVLSHRDVPTPVVAYEIVRRGAAGGINITASHNPPEYSGIKFSPAEGCPAPVEVTAEIEEIIAGLQRQGGLSVPAENIATHDFAPAYCNRVKELIDFDALSQRPQKVAYNPLWGTGRDYVDRLLREAGWQVDCVHCKVNPGFGGRRPEPSPSEMPDFVEMLSAGHYALGLATDGDGDRYGVIDSDGGFIPPNQVLALLFHYLITQRGFEGGVARSVATSHLVDRVASFHNREVYETPVGFKHIAKYIMDGTVAIGGEESAGLTIKGHVPEKDGIIACLLLAEMVAKTGASLNKLRDELFDKVGRLYSERVDIPLSSKRIDEIRDRLNEVEKIFAHRGVDHLTSLDGRKVVFGDGSWVLFRLSGTEPVVRFYAEAASEDVLKGLIEEGIRWLKG